MNFEFRGHVWEWRGPAPFYFIRVPVAQSDEIRAAVKVLSYGWGMIPVVATIRGLEFTTSMFAKDGTYVLPLKNAVRLPLKLEVDELIEVAIRLGA
jgi:hypothetical protein